MKGSREIMIPFLLILFTVSHVRSQFFRSSEIRLPVTLAADAAAEIPDVFCQGDDAIDCGNGTCHTILVKREGTEAVYSYECRCHNGWGNVNPTGTHEERRCTVSKREARITTTNDGWRRVTQERNPPSEVPYFFAENNDERRDYKFHLTLKSDALKIGGIPAALKDLEVSFEFWSDFNETAIGEDEDTIFPIEVRVERGFHLVLPAKLDIKSSKNEWTKFTHKFDAIEPTDHHVTLVVHLRKEFDTFVAIRNFGLVAKIAATPSDDTTVIDYPINCRNQTHCEKNFDYEYSTPDAAVYKWVEDGRPPTGDPDPKGYWIPSEKSKPFVFNFTDFRQGSDVDAVIKFKYWISSDEPALMISRHRDPKSEGAIFAQLTKTQDVATTDRVSWYHGEVLLSEIHPPFNVTGSYPDNDELLIYFIPYEFEKHLIAIEFLDKAEDADGGSIIYGEKNPVIHDFILHSSHRSDPWITTSLPSERTEIGHNAEDGSLTDAVTVTLVPGESPSAMYTLHSQWLLSTKKNLPMSATIRVEGEADDSVIVVVNVVDYTEKSETEKQIRRMTLPGKRSESLDKVIVASTAGTEESLRRIQVIVMPEKTLKGSVKVTIEDVTFGDRCFFANPCNIKSQDNACIPEIGYGYKCICDKVWIGDRCERENYCETELIEEMTGYSYCKERANAIGKYCTPHLEKSGNPNIPSFDCMCDPADYWDARNARCSKFSECMLVTSCPGNTACDEENYSDENPCAGCRVGFEKVNDTCEPIDPCPGKCGIKSLCKSLIEPDQVPMEVCYCPDGFTIDPETGTTCTAAKLRQECPEIYRVSAGCHHTCKVDQSNMTAGITVSCACYAGYELRSDGKSCEAGKSLSSLDPKCDHEHEMSIEENGKAVCVCQPGFAMDRDKRCVSLRYCEKDENAHDIESFCGRSVTTCEESGSTITCKCRPGTKHENYEFGKKFGCVHLSEKQTCTEFEKSAKSGDKKSGQKCRQVVLPKDEKYGERLGMVFSCPPSQSIDPIANACKDRCDIKDNILQCLRDSKVCVNNPYEETIDCTCAPGFTEVRGRCHAATSVVKINKLQIKLPLLPASRTSDSNSPVTAAASLKNDEITKICYEDPDPSGCMEKIQLVKEFVSKDQNVITFLQRQALRNKVTGSFKAIFSGIIEGYTAADILSDPVIKDDTLFTDVSLIFIMNKNPGSSSNVGSPNELAEQLLSKCTSKKARDGDYCVLPGGLAFKIASLEAGNKSATNLDPCTETSVTYCSKEAECSNVKRNDDDWSFPHNCTCKKGYRLEQVSFFNVTDSVSRREIRKEFCADVDECRENTHTCDDKNSICMNMDGDYDCRCKAEFKPIKGSRPTKCVPVCKDVNCVNGECQLHPLMSNSFECKCANGFTGTTCEFEDEKAKSFRTTLIAVASVLSILLVIAIIAAVIIYKKKKNDDDDTYYGQSSYQRPMPARISSPVNNEKRPHSDTHF